MSDLFSVSIVAKTIPENFDGGPTNLEELMAFCARVSSGRDDKVVDYHKLLTYCQNHGHWSVFQMANVILSIKGPRDILRQFTRHESIVVVETNPGEYVARPDGIDLKAGGLQEFSQRYSSAIEMHPREYRGQHPTNRQASTDDLSDDTKLRAQIGQRQIIRDLSDAYGELVEMGVAKECARVVLPEGLVQSHIFANATVRSWLHYLKVREGEGTQREHQELAARIREVLQPLMPSLLVRL